jgi:hypothetical protein
MVGRLGKILIVMAVAACGSSSDPAPAPAASGPTSAAATEPSPPLAERVQVDQVEILQGTTAVLATAGAVVDLAKRNAPVIAGRPGLVRVHATKLLRPKLPALAAELRVHRRDQDDLVVYDTPKTITDYDPADLSTTWDFELGADAITADARIEVALRDPKGAPDDVSVFPPLDQPTMSLGARAKATTLRVKFVPIKYGADASERLPLLDDRTVEQYRQSLYKMYPAATVDVSVREPLPWGGVVSANGNGWDDLLAMLMQVRRADHAADDLYYVGVFEPAASVTDFCSSGGCVLGVAPQAGIKDIGMHAALILGYGGDGRNGTLAQELAHSMGRGHAPCGNPAFPDPDFPYGSGRIGVAGYDIVAKTLFSPGSGSHDFMSYCSPVWVSDYTFAGIAQRMVDVDEAMPHENVGVRLNSVARAISVDGSGNMKLGPQLDVRGAPGEGDVAIHYEDGAGGSLGEARASLRRYDSIPGGILVAAEPPPNARRVRVPSLSARALDLGFRGVAAVPGR